MTETPHEHLERLYRQSLVYQHGTPQQLREYFEEQHPQPRPTAEQRIENWIAETVRDRGKRLRELTQTNPITQSNTQKKK